LSPPNTRPWRPCVRPWGSITRSNMWLGMNTSPRVANKTPVRAFVGDCYDRFWLGPIGVFPGKGLEFHLMNCPRACSDVEAHAARGLAHSSGAKPQMNRTVADDFEKNNEFSPSAQACGVLGIFSPRMTLHDGELSLRAYTTSGVLKSPRTPDIVSSHQPVRWTVREFHTQKITPTRP